MKMPALITALALSVAAWLPAQADDNYPSQPIRVVVPFQPGSSPDATMRFLGQQLSEILKQPIVIDNRPGAGGLMGGDNLAKSKPDGYSLGYLSNQHLLHPYMVAKMPYDPLTAFTQVATLGRSAQVLLVPASNPAGDLKAFIAGAKAKGGTVKFGSGGIGSPAHLAGQVFAKQAGLPGLHVPYKGAAPATIDTVAGNVSVLFAAYPSVSAQVRAGRLKALAVTSLKRLAVAPELPTVAEAALKDFESSQWWGLYGPAGLPAAMVERMNAATNKVLVTDDIKKALALDGAEPSGGTPAALAAYHKADYEKWGKVIATANIKAN